ncbi:S8 family serine peptidase [Kribbella sp. NPDC023855]|uniref:S8 family peptidase n=1 Tax=Kribbella sp. NPDC023855 TaxID=3154698 RepID=UPI00340BE5E3
MAVTASLAVATTGITGASQGAVAAQSAPTSPAAKPAAQALDKHVTLLTGDRVTLVGGDPAKASVQPAPGRKHMTFRTQQVKDQLFVIPSDLSGAVASGRLDRRLFDVQGLIKAGYDDRASKVIPLVVTYQARAKRSTLPGATISRALPAVNGSAVKVQKKDTAAFLGGLGFGSPAALASNGIAKVWLDGKRKISLDQSVPQIGGPAAWQAGYTGKGVTVAVLDTGIDSTHPDLAPQLAGAANFTEEAPGDLVGHGTHVASTIAGTAAASAGKYRGVAPDAKLYDGKVCEEFGCAESAILAGMEWAATEVKANIVNLSLGGSDSPEIDPLEEAVNRLTEQTGTLFVIAAGNSGPRESSVESPGSAEAALTVGAVDKQDQLAEFSSRGPRVGDGGVKPDVTAPGVDIVAAKSKDSTIGTPVGDQYLNLSGTSMATPHTAGAAALLLQQHPSWKAGELKGALMASAKSAPDQGIFEQGAGRIDLTKAIKQTLISEPAGLGFGTALWPHTDDAPVTKEVTYRNLGDQPVTLNLSAELAGPDGAPAPAGALKLSADTVTVPAGGTAMVTATSNTNHSGADGNYLGRITAKSADTTVVTPVVLTKEVESHTLTLTMIGPDGQPAQDGHFTIFGLGDFLFEYPEAPNGTARMRLPKAEYNVEGGLWAQRPGREDYNNFHLVQPIVQLDADTTIVMDVRTTKPVNTTVPRADAKVMRTSVGYTRWNHARTSSLNSSLVSDYMGQAYTAQLGPAAPAEQLIGYVSSFWGLPGPNEDFRNTPFQYGLLTPMPGRFPTGFERTVKAADLAVVDQTVNATGDRSGQRLLSGRAGWVGGSSLNTVHDLPATIRLYLDAAPVEWSTRVAELAPGPRPSEVTEVISNGQQYQAGRTYRQRLNAAVFGPTPDRVSRQGNYLLVLLFATTDAAGGSGRTRADTEVSKLYRNGRQIAEFPYFGAAEAFDVPAERAQYKLVTTLTRPSYSSFSTRIDLTSTFSSAGTANETSLPLRTVRYQPAVDQRNTVLRTAVTELPVVLDGMPGAVLPAVSKLQVQVSGDEGKTWKAAAVVRSGDGYKAIFGTPKGGSVSLKAYVADTAGNTTEQTVIGAYLLR